MQGMENVFSTTNHESHASQRRLLSASLSESNLKQFERVIAEKANLAVERIGEKMKKTGAADVMKRWLFMATDIIGDSALARASECQRKDGILSAEPQNPKPTLFSKLYRAGEEGMSQQDIISEAQAYVVAGSDTAAISLTYPVWAVCRNNEVKRTLVNEVTRLPDGYTDNALKTAPYLNQVIYEALRVYAAAPSALLRETPLGGAEVDGYWMPGGTTVCIQAYSLHRDPNIFPGPGSSHRYVDARLERQSPATALWPEAGEKTLNEYDRTSPSK
ncbi:hypothetical protein N0V83_002525 [Neocucurbitaria cava]|uniref:Cytochrome P450 n=1 Tax=Neocucurbitaria cava TaxID=798079 RepID=A0A9W9CNS5_9PLEO|nr:hypothetical protein N0V83_002525 [Neocucurbitaria cava]